ncbi:MAG: ABC transporter permease [Lachnospiraceae bacterium]|nr:ABC transporter permease [Lachnospiraceae bacterium]
MLLENIRLAILALKANKLRTFLTMLGIIIGLASVVMIMTIGNAMNNMVNSQIGDIGANNFYLFVNMRSVDAEGNEINYETARGMKSSDYITKEMLEDIQAKYQDKIDGISIFLPLGSTKIEKGKDSAKIKIYGSNPMAIKSENLKLLAGSTFAAGDYSRGSNVCLVSDRYVNVLYGGDVNAALGENVEAAIDGKYSTYTITGVYEYNAKSMGMAGVSDKDLETECYVPLRAAVQQNPKITENIQEITLVASEGNDPTITAAQIAKYLNERYYKNNDTYELYPYSLKQEAESLQKVLNSVKLAFLAVGAISLLVGGIGVMNIMIVSIVERTREIGTRKALGATNGSIRLQFITESMVVCLVGGAIGITLGVLLGQVVSVLLGASGMPSVLGILGCLLFSMAFGVFFGYYPANRAAKLNPIEALRYE